MPTNVGTANYATHFGIVGITCTWLGRSGGARVGTILNALEVSAGGEVTQTRDNSNEVQATRTTNDTIQITATVKPVSSTAALALAILGDLPKKNSIFTIVADAADTDISTAGTILVDEARKSYTPDGEGIINFTLTKHVGKTFVALS